MRANVENIIENIPVEVEDLSNDFPNELLEIKDPLEMAHSVEIAATHPAEPDLFARHEGIPAHDQELLQAARVLFVGGGGLNSWSGVGMARSGVRTMTVVDGDRVDRTNLSRQFFTADDLGMPKGKRLARQLAGQAVGGADVTGIGLPFDEAIETFSIPADLIIAGVDNNECRLRYSHANPQPSSVS